MARKNKSTDKPPSIKTAQEFGNYLRDKRLRAGLSLGKLGECITVSGTGINQLEQGIFTLGPERLDRVSTWAGLPNSLARVLAFNKKVAVLQGRMGFDFLPTLRLDVLKVVKQ